MCPSSPKIFCAFPAEDHKPVKSKTYTPDDYFTGSTCPPIEPSIYPRRKHVKFMGAANRLWGLSIGFWEEDGPKIIREPKCRKTISSFVRYIFAGRVLAVVNTLYVEIVSKNNSLTYYRQRWGSFIAKISCSVMEFANDSWITRVLQYQD